MIGVGTMGKRGNSPCNAQFPLAPLCTHLQVERGKGRPIPTPPPIYTAREGAVAQQVLPGVKEVDQGELREEGGWKIAVINYATTE